MPRNLETDDAREMAASLTEALPDVICLRAALVAVGIVASSLIEQAPPGARDELTETFCGILRKGTRTSH